MKLITAKISEVMAACAYVQKDKKNKDQGYSYVSAAAILDQINEELVKRKIATFATSEIVATDVFRTLKGTEYLRVTVKTTVTLIDSESGESVMFVGFGCGADPGDKAVMKAQTAALKYAYMMSLNISTGDDPEADTPEKPKNDKPEQRKSEPQKPPAQTPAPQMATEAQRKKIDELRNACGWSTDDIKAEIALTYKVKSSRELTLQQAKQMIDRLETALAEKGKETP